jgi:hypothetical protein
MRRRLVTLGVLATFLAPLVAGPARPHPLVADPFSAPAHCSSDAGQDVALAWRRIGATAVLGAILGGASRGPASRLRPARRSVVAATAARVPRSGPRALMLARFHRKRPAPAQGHRGDPPLAL